MTSLYMSMKDLQLSGTTASFTVVNVRKFFRFLESVSNIFQSRLFRRKAERSVTIMII